VATVLRAICSAYRRLYSSGPTHSIRRWRATGSLQSMVICLLLREVTGMAPRRAPGGDGVKASRHLAADSGPVLLPWTECPGSAPLADDRGPILLMWTDCL